VQKALNVPNFGEWSLCSEGNVFQYGDDNSAYSETLFPYLLATLPHGITLWHGLEDGILLSLGDRITIQNLTWGGAQGFQTAPTTPLILNGAQMGIYHTERNLTYMEVNGGKSSSSPRILSISHAFIPTIAGHMIPESNPRECRAARYALTDADGGHSARPARIHRLHRQGHALREGTVQMRGALLWIAVVTV
jgi:carboxypeptidase C (cathepsin A)